MTLTIHQEEDTQRQLLLTVEVAQERVEKAMRQTAKKLAKDVRIPGFRQGKAPYHVILRRVGREALLAETVDDLVPEVFEEALANVTQEDFFARPELTDVDLDPMVLKFSIPLIPVVKLGEYRDYRQEIEPVTVTEEAVTQALEQIQNRHQVLEDVDRPAEPGDVVTLSGLGKLVVTEETAVSPTPLAAAEADVDQSAQNQEAEEKIIFAEERVELLMDAAKVFPNTPFVDHILGLGPGEQASFTFTFPEDYADEELAGKKASFDITVLNVQSREVPPLDDELAKLEGKHETLAELKEGVRENLLKSAEAEAEEKLIEGLAEKLLENAEITFPPAAVEQEMDLMLQKLKNQARYAGWQWEDYLQLQGLTEEGLRDSFRETAVSRLKRNLIIRQFILNEKLQVKPEAIDELVEQRISKYENEDLRNNMRDYFSKGAGLETIRGDALHELIVERIKAIYTGTAPDLADLEDEDEGRDEEE